MTAEALSTLPNQSPLEALRRAGDAYCLARATGPGPELDTAVAAVSRAIRAMNENLLYANLTKARLRRFNLASFHGDCADFTDADLTDAVCYHASWVGASFVRANLTDCTFSHSDLQGADFRGATMKGTDFVGADLRGAKFDSEQLAYIARRAREGYGEPTTWPEEAPPPLLRTAVPATEPLGEHDRAGELEEQLNATAGDTQTAARGENLSLF